MAFLLAVTFVAVGLAVAIGLVVRALIVDPEIMRAQRTLSERGVFWRHDALSVCHRGLIVGYREGQHDYCATCGASLTGEGDDFWVLYRRLMQASGDHRMEEDVSLEAHNAIRALRDDLQEHLAEQIRLHPPAMVHERR